MEILLNSIRSKKTLKPYISYDGYEYFTISVGNIRKTLKGHRLVAEAFIPNPDNKPTVNHKDGNRTNNCVDNLEWATSYEQTHDKLTFPKLIKACTDRDFKAMGAIRNFGRKRTEVYDLNGDFIGAYDSLLAAAESVGSNYTKASEVLNGKRKHSNGYVFKEVAP